MDENSMHGIVHSPVFHENIWGKKSFQVIFEAEFSFSSMKISFFMHVNVIFMHEIFMPQYFIMREISS